MQQRQLAVSSIAFGDTPVADIIELVKAEGWTLEFSSGLPYLPDMERIYLDAPVSKLIHNYFPAPAEPFVLNLASRDTDIRNRSIAHCVQGLQLAKQSGVAFFSVHAGFCMDPRPEQLGQQLDLAADLDRSGYMTRFLASLTELLGHADALGCDLFIENNVLTRFNNRLNNVPLLCCDPHEMIYVMEHFRHPRLGLLLDTAHLKVSAKTLGFNMDNAVIQTASYIKAMHHSDNDGKVDNNRPISEDYWFLKHMPRFRQLPHVLEVRDVSTESIHRQFRLLTNSANAQ